MIGSTRFVSHALTDALSELHRRIRTSFIQTTRTEVLPDGGTKDSVSEHESRSTHLDELPDGSGCTEIWEYLSDKNEEQSHAPEDARADPGE